MSAHTEYRSHHQIIADSQIGTMPAYIQEKVDNDYARHQRETAEYHAALAAEARNPLGPWVMDPSAGDVRRSFYETMRVRGE